jgi:hypothetical protein
VLTLKQEVGGLESSNCQSSTKHILKLAQDNCEDVWKTETMEREALDAAPGGM